MFGKLLKRFFGGRNAARPVSPPPPPIPRSTPVAASAPPPPPPAAAAASPPETPLRQQGRVKVILQDGTVSDPFLDPDLEERLKYIVDNIVPPSNPPTT